MRAIPVELREANEFIARHHRHLGIIQGHRFSIGAMRESDLVGVIVVGRPVGGIHQREWAEVTRCCSDGTKNACSFLYGAASRAARAMGFWRLQTYLLDTDNGASLLASGWKFERMSHPVGWHHDGPRAARTVKHELMKRKQLWFIELNSACPLPVFKFLDDSQLRFFGIEK